jgi:carbon storage regulator
VFHPANLDRTICHELKGSIMLVLSRRAQESVVVGSHDGSGRVFKVTVIRVRGGEVRLGFEGPAQIAVHRLEVWERICAERAGPKPRAPCATTCT